MTLARSVYLETFGCQMNELDSQLVAGALRSLGYRFVDSPEHADVVLYNTCSVREHAEQKVWSRLGEVKQRKIHEPHVVVGVLGCMAERDGVDLLRRMPQVDVLCGPAELDKLPSLLDNAVRTRESLLADESHPHHWARSAKQVALQGAASRRSSTLAAAEDTLELLDLSRAVSPTDHAGSAYVRITRGCNKFCTYCVVPHTRGAEIHRPPDHIVDECKRLADAGVLEVTLLGQTVNHYRFEHGAAVSVGGVVQPQKGRTYKGAHNRDAFAGERVTTFADLLARIHDEVPAIQRLRFVTSYPRDFGDDALEVIRDHPRLCRYLHVPAQSGSDRMLKTMNRGYTIAEYDEFLHRARSILHQPEIGRPLMVSGDMIVGFCTETEEDHQASMRLIERANYKSAFIFKYSPRPGTVAYDKMPDDVPDEVKRRRNNEMLALQASVSERVMRELVGSTFEVMVEGVSQKQARRAKRAADASGVSLTIGGKDPRATATVDEPASAEPVQLAARTDADAIVHFDCPPGRSAADMIGRIVRVKITSSSALSLSGELAG
ncbi:MAG: MiaB/RimO family radical SAM methylthiotransferase [Phycisphaeraceae bacterium]|nr:MiaB/RimO family radical SAM methylthiotransferase [Phycisphaeraceae bacterium]